MIFQTNSAEETKKVAQKIAKKFTSGGTLALFGTLGAGKTTFTQGFAKKIGVKEKIISPTFIIKREYEIPQNSTGKFYHIDLYRLDDIKQVKELGISEIFANPQNIILIEWAEKLGDLLPSNAIKINFEISSDNKRIIRVENNL